MKEEKEESLATTEREFERNGGLDGAAKTSEDLEE